MKITKRNDTLSKEGIRPDFEQSDVIYLNKLIHTPKTQIFSSEEIIEDRSQEQFFCALCKGKLDYIKKMEMWTCTQCVEYYDPNLQSGPLKDTTDFKLTSHTDLMHYPTADLDDSFFEAINLIEKPEEGLENRSYEDQRVQHLSFKNITFADAILKGVLTAKKKLEEDNDT